MNGILYLFAFISLVFAKSCNSENCLRGSCVDEKCVCETFFEGENCSVRWNVAHQNWNLYFIIYQLLTSFLNFILMVFSANNIVILFRTKVAINPITLTLFGAFIGATIRFFYYAIDPHTYYNVFPNELEGFLFSLPIVIWLDSAFLMSAFWVEFVNFTKAPQLKFVHRLRPIFIGLAIITGLILLPISIVLGVTLSPLVYAIYNGVVGFLLLLLICLTSYGGFRFLNFLRKFYKVTQNEGYKNLLIKMTTTLLGLNLFPIGIIIVLVIFTIIGYNRPWIYLSLQLILRFGEFGTGNFYERSEKVIEKVFSMLFIVTTQKPTGSAQKLTPRVSMSSAYLSNAHSNDQNPSTEEINK